MAGPRVACIGECMIELSDLGAPDGRVRMGVAGDTLNTAVYLSRLMGGGGQVAYLTALGDDRLSDGMIAFMRDEGIDTAGIARLPGRRPGLYAIDLAPDGERSFHYWRSEAAARAMLGPGGIDLGALAGRELVYLSGITLAILPPADRAALIDRLGALRAGGLRVAFDSNYRPRLWPDAATARAAMAAMWAATDIALPSLDDEAALWGGDAGEVLARLAGAGVGEIALKRGADGPLLHPRAGAPGAAYPPVPEVRDTTAAGDAFNAGYLATRLAGGDPDAAARRGHALACHVIGLPGAIVPLGPGWTGAAPPA
ncbi:sugar kinase [Roseicyclus persicicus]|uniref:Sugar kinase n=1 Tax=Roseicyclus persicicus TaxID=2650661 RepID=A0A7X6H2S4_9RHOB|nr:sugar kinase [Roseibacterium persicicum]NKX45697.1 sugar kinase [Roseibacterium persicicum]